MTPFGKLKQRRCREGFTVLEVVVSSVIVMIVFVAVMSAMSYGRRTASLTENQLASLHIARQRLEALSKLSYSAADLAVGTKQLPGNRGYYVVTENAAGNTKDVRVTVNWAEPSGMTQSVSLVTSISRSLHK